MYPPDDTIMIQHWKAFIYTKTSGVPMSIHMNAKRTMLIGIGLLAILMLATVPMMAMAQEGNTDPAQDPATNGGRERQRLKLRVDRDGDGSISLREFNAFVNGRLDNDTVKRIFNAADKDQNGQLSRREFVHAVRLALKANNDDNGMTPDKDGDGNVSLREFHAFVNKRLDNDTIKRIFNAADKDQNGQLNRREFGYAVSLAAKAKVKENAPDRDGDGYISLREFNAFVNGRLDNDTMKRIFNAADKDQDGQLSRREFTYAMRLGMKAYRSQNSEGSGNCSGECSEDGSNERERNENREQLREKLGERIRERIRERMRHRQRQDKSDA